MYAIMWRCEDRRFPSGLLGEVYETQEEAEEALLRLIRPGLNYTVVRLAPGVAASVATVAGANGHNGHTAAKGGQRRIEKRR